jgi:hypothetical protein
VIETGPVTPYAGVILVTVREGIPPVTVMSVPGSVVLDPPALATVSFAVKLLGLV